jgi:hypothetical protein
LRYQFLRTIQFEPSEIHFLNHWILMPQTVVNRSFNKRVKDEILQHPRHGPDSDSAGRDPNEPEYSIIPVTRDV